MRKAIDAIKARAPKPVKRAYGRAKSQVKAFLRSVGFNTARCDVRGVSVLLGLSSDLEQFRADSYASKEPETLDWLDEKLTDADVLMDIGANIGLYSLYAAKLKPGCKVYAFEPEAQNFSRLCRNVVLNGVSNLIPCGFPLSDKEAFGLFYVSELEAGSAENSFGVESAYLPAGSAALLQGSLATTVDALIHRHGLPSPALIKLDVDGLEEEILEGARQLLKSRKVKSVLVELNLKDGAGPAKAVKLLEDAGYKLARKGSQVYEWRGIRSQNYIFDLAGAR